MSKSAPLTFEVWFELQFGKRPSDESIYDLEKKAEATERQAMNARHLVEDVDLWEANRMAAQYAWMIRDSEKGKIR